MHLWEGRHDVKQRRGGGGRLPRGVVLSLALGLAFLGSACGGAEEGPRPTPTFGLSKEAENNFRLILAKFEARPREQRGDLAAELEAFRTRYSGDPLARKADAMRATIALDAGNLDEADALAARVEAGDEGSTRNLALVVRGGVLRRRGEPEQALLLLLPLSHKLVDAEARELQNEEAVLAAIDANRPDLALVLMEGWLRETGRKTRTEERVAVLVAALDPRAVLSYLDAATEHGIPENTNLLSLAAHLLAEVAEQRVDAALAKRLLARVGPLLGDDGDRVARLASGVTTSRIAGPTVGLVLSLGSPELRRRGADVAAGVAHALRLPGSSARLASRDDAGDPLNVAAAVSGLGAEGAAIVVAGFDEESARMAAAAAETQGIPVLLLTAPSAWDPRPDGFVFILGDGPTLRHSRLEDALTEAGSRQVVILDCESETTSFGPHVGVLIDRVLPCYERRLPFLPTARGRLAYGLDTVGLRVPSGAFYAAVGAFPLTHAVQTSSADLREWLLAKHDPPSYWAGMGHDAGLLAWGGVRELPARSTEDPAEVRALRRGARDALARAQGDLWTTEARGFDGARRIKRTVVVEKMP